MTGMTVMSFAWDDSVRAFADAAGWYVDTVRQVGDRWEQPGLGEWDVRALVGHTSRSFLTVESYLARPAAGVDVVDATDYYVATRGVAAGPEVAQRGRDAGAALGEDPAGAVAQIAARVVPLVEQQDGNALLTTVAGGMRLADYLPTRTFELVVHGADLARALDLPADPPDSAARQALHLVTELALGRGLGGTLLLAATGRAAPPFSVL
jgi:uncharacterized protein (TIGR03083 family)